MADKILMKYKIYLNKNFHTNFFHTIKNKLSVLSNRTIRDLIKIIFKLT